MARGSVGIQIGATTAPEDLAEVAREAEQLGYGEIWMAEDYFQLGGIASVSTALASTARIPVGLDVVAAPVRHPAAMTMEFATLGEIHPGRFMAGLGHRASRCRWRLPAGRSPRQFRALDPLQYAGYERPVIRRSQLVAWDLPRSIQTPSVMRRRKVMPMRARMTMRSTSSAAAKI